MKTVNWTALKQVDIIHVDCLSAYWNVGFFLFTHLGVAARETAQALKTLAQAARGVAASTTDPQSAGAMLDSARDVMEGSAMLIYEAKQALVCPGDAESQQRLAQVRDWLLTQCPVTKR